MWLPSSRRLVILCVVVWVFCYFFSSSKDAEQKPVHFATRIEKRRAMNQIEQTRDMFWKATAEIRFRKIAQFHKDTKTSAKTSSSATPISRTSQFRGMTEALETKPSPSTVSTTPTFVASPESVKRAYSNYSLLTKDELNHEVIAGAWKQRSDGKTFQHEPSYVITNRDFCGRENFTLLIFIESAPRNFRRRKIWRRTCGSYKNSTKTLFVLALDAQAETNREVYKESRIFGDILLLNYTDAYYELTKKTLWTLIWIKNSCRMAKFILKTDDDVLIHTKNIVDDLRRMDHTENIYMGETPISFTPQRTPGLRWTMKYDIFPFEFYPQYILGGGVILSQRAVAESVEKSKYVAFVPFEDVYVGLLASAAKIVPRTVRNFVYYLNLGKYTTDAEGDFLRKRFVLAHGFDVEVFDKIWKTFNIT